MSEAGRRAVGPRYTLGELARRLELRLRGDAGQVIESVATLQGAGPRALSFLANRRYRPALRTTRAEAVILAEEFLADCPVAALVGDNPYAAFARAAALLAPPRRSRQGVEPSAVVEEGAEVAASAWVGPNTVVGRGARIGERVELGPCCVIGEGVSIGEDSRLSASVTLCPGVRIGRRVLVHPGVVIGADGFGIANEEGVWIKVPQLGAVVVGDDVEIGANTTIDRGALEDTVIGEGVKLDNLIQIGHNVRIGEHTAIAACVAIGGSARIGRRCTIGGAASLAGHIEIADDVHLTATSAVANSIKEPGVYSSGMPVQENRAWRRSIVRLRQLDDLARRLRALERGPRA